MPLQGRAFLAIWHGLAEGYEEKFQRWHTEEHMPERVGVPGFLQGRRYMRGDPVDQICFTLYVGAHIETFRSPGYLARLNAPTEWAKRVQPSLINFQRFACETVLSLGEGVGGAIATFRLSFAAGEAQSALNRLSSVCYELKKTAGVSAVHLGGIRLDVTAERTEEIELRGASGLETRADAVLMIEAIGRTELESILPKTLADVEASGVIKAELGQFTLAYFVSA